MAGRGVGGRVMVFMGLEFIWEDGESWRWLVGGCRTMRMHLLPLNCAPKNGEAAGVQAGVMCILSQ